MPSQVLECKGHSCHAPGELADVPRRARPLQDRFGGGRAHRDAGVSAADVQEVWLLAAAPPGEVLWVLAHHLLRP